jgi:hypothetical protein
MLMILPVAMPGSGVGLFNACTDEWNAPSSGWGAQYGGISSNTCSTFPKALQAGCGFRFDWFEGADNPEVEFERVECPAEIVAKSGCKRDDDGAQKAVEAPASSKAPVASSSPVAASSSVEAASVASSASSTSESAPIATSVEAVASSAEAYTAPVESSAGAYTTSTPESSAAYTSAAAMASSPSSSSSAAATSSAITPSSSATSSEDAACNVQYVYEYDL